MQPSEMVMNPKQVFLSLLLFGVAGLLLFMYLQVWIEEHHAGRMGQKGEQKATSERGPVSYLQPALRIMTTEKIQEHITNQFSGVIGVCCLWKKISPPWIRMRFLGSCLRLPSIPSSRSNRSGLPGLTRKHPLDHIGTSALDTIKTEDALSSISLITESAPLWLSQVYVHPSECHSRQTAENQALSSRTLPKEILHFDPLFLLIVKHLTCSYLLHSFPVHSSY